MSADRRPWRIRLLGELRATRGDTSITRFRTQKTAGLLGYLAFHSGRAHPREVLIELLWPGGKPEAGRSSLSAALSSLRSQLEPPGTVGAVILASRATVELAPGTFTTDVAELRAALESAARATGAARLEALGAALDAYGGELLPGFYQDWIAGERARLVAAFVRAARDLARELARAGRLSDAVDALRRAVAADPLAEEARSELEELDKGEPARTARQLAELEAQRRRAPTGTVTFLLVRGALPAKHEGHVFELESGVAAAAFARPSDALAAAAALGDARGAIDTREVRGGYERGTLERALRLLGAAREGQVVVSEESAALLRRDREGGGLVDAGLYRLAGATERLFVLDRGVSADTKLDAEPVHRGHAPLELTRFFGREDELARLRELVALERLVTITGPGGMGKTRIALEALQRRWPPAGEAAWFVPLADVLDARSVPAAVARALKVGPGPEREPLDRIADFLRGVPALLVLDNLEQLAGAIAPVVRGLLERAPALAIVATSRVRLGLEGERELALAPLAQDVALRVFLDRAQAVRPDFELTPANEGAVNELVRRLEGVPLALALAAARTQVLSPGQILERLSAPFDLLATRRADLPERHRTLRATIDASWELLSPELRRFFAALSVFRGGFTLESAEAVCEEPLALDLLAQLRDASLVTASEGELRFALLETLRTYGQEKLPEEERRELGGHHAEHFLDLAERAERAHRSPDAAAWLDRLAADMENLEAAIEWCLGEPGAEGFALRIAAALVHYWHVRGPISAGRRLLAAGLASAAPDPAVRVRALSGAALLALLQSDHAAASALQEGVLALERAKGDRAAIARALVNLGLVKTRTSDLEQARRALEEGAAILRELGVKPGLAVAHQNLGSVFFMLGRSVEARALYQETLDLQRELGDRRGAALALASLGTVSLIRGEHARAREQLEAALLELRALGNQEAIARTLVDLGVLHEELGDAPAARAAFEESLALQRATGARTDIAFFHLGRLAAEAGALGEARSLLEESEKLARKIGRGESLACVLTAKGDLLRRQGELALARAAHDESAAIVRATGERPYLPWQLEQAAELARELGETERAVKLLAASTALRQSAGHPLAPLARPRVEALRRALEGALGESFAPAWEAGATLGERALEVLYRVGGGLVPPPSAQSAI